MLRLQLARGPPSCLSVNQQACAYPGLQPARTRPQNCRQRKALGRTARIGADARQQSTPVSHDNAEAAQPWTERLAQAFVGPLLSAALAFSGAPAGAAAVLDATAAQQMQETLVKAWEAVEDKFVDPYDHELWASLLQESSGKLAHVASKEEGYAVIGSMLSSLGDQYTRILPPDQAKVFKADTTGSVVHVGLQLERVDTGTGPFVRASFVLTGSPAAAAGLRAGDIVHSINGRAAVDVDARELRTLLHQSVQVSVQQSRPGAPMAMRNLYLTARPVEVYPVIHQALAREDGGVTGYLAIQSFSANTGADAAAALRALVEEHADALILDLRGNSGGLVSTGLEVAGLLLAPEDVFCYVAHRDGAASPIYVDSEAPLSGAPLVVLVNGGTASTSEVLAGALAHNGRGALAGRHTFGKGRTQRVVPLPDASTLLVSNALVTTPARAPLDKVGLEPSRHCAAGKGLPDALSREPLEPAALEADLRADACVRAALQALSQQAATGQRA